MKTINAFYISVIVKENVITAAAHFNYMEAVETMISMLSLDFNIKTDDAIIYEFTKPGEGTPVFNFRAYLNDEEKPERPTGKENRYVKIFFQCPECLCNEGKLKADEDGDIVMECKRCSSTQLVHS